MPVSGQLSVLRAWEEVKRSAKAGLAVYWQKWAETHPLA